jgi:hypothetical protein
MALVPIKKLDRKVIFIKGFAKNEQELSATIALIDKYKEWFKSNAGGAYEENEIKTFEDITTEELKVNLESDILDFVVVVAIGHGANQEDCQLFGLNHEETIKLGQIVELIKSDKQLWLIESCRELRLDIEAIDLNDKKPSFKKGGVLPPTPITREKSRALYDKQIKNCDTGNVIFFACSKDEKAMNAIFTRHVLDWSHNWHLSLNNNSAHLNITNLMSYIKFHVNETAIQERKQEQHPELLGNIDFPFAVSKYYR